MKLPLERTLTMASEISGPAYTLSCLNDGLKLMKYMDLLCLHEFSLEETGSTAFNESRLRYDYTSFYFDSEKLERRGGLAYLRETLKSHFDVDISEVAMLDSALEVLTDSDFICTHIDDHASPEAISDLTGGSVSVSLPDLVCAIERALGGSLSAMKVSLDSYVRDLDLFEAEQSKSH